jgi:hypothetical protein
MKALIRYGALTCAVILGACSDATGPDADTPLLNADLAVVMADAAGEDVDIMREPVNFQSMSPSFGPGFGDMNPANCVYNPLTQRLACVPVTRRELVITRSYKFWDTNNEVQQAYDALLTAKANINTTIVGEHEGENWSASIDRFRDMTVTGLVGTETQRTWNGNGEDHLSRSRHNEAGERTYTIVCTVQVVNVVVPVPNGSGDRFPISGTITRQCTVTFDGGPHDGQTVQRTAVITFNGTQTATLTIGGRTFDIDLKLRRRFQRP